MARDKDSRKKRRDDEEVENEPVNIEEELADLESAWDEAEEKSGGEITDGTYQARVTGAKIGKSKASGRLQVAWEFTIISGEFKNRKAWTYSGLETKENLGWLKTMLARLKLSIPKKLTDLPEILEAAIGLTAEIRLKTKGDFQNLHVQKLIDVDGEEVENGGDDWEPSDRSKGKGDKKKSRDEDEDEDSDEDDEDTKAVKRRAKQEDDREDEAEESDEDDDDEPKKGKSKKSKDEDDEDEDDADEDDEPKSKSKGRKDEDDEDESNEDDADEDDRKKKRKKSKF